MGEAFAIDIKRDIDLEKGTLAVNQQVQWLNGHWTFTEPKYDSFRVIKLDRHMLAELIKVIDRQERAEVFYAEYYTHLYENSQRQIVTEQEEGCREIHMLSVRENGTYVQPRVMAHCGRVIHYELGFKNYDYHSLRHPYVKPTTKKFLSFFKFEMAISLRAFLCFALLLGIKEGPQLVPFIR